MKAIKPKLFILISLLFALLLIKPPFVKSQENSIDNGISWLLNSQNEDGSWSSGPKIFLDSYTVLETLLFLNFYDSQVSSGIDWINQMETANIDDLSHQVIILSSAGEDVESKLNTLLDSQNLDGSWGFCEECESSLLDTILALLALKAANYYNESVIGKALYFISSNQNPDGGLSFGDNDSSIYLTSLFILSLKEYLSEYQSIQSYIDLASSYLLTRKNPDGSYGMEDNKIFETSLACRALIAAGKYFEGLAIRDYLLSTQDQNGSWEDDAYSTALALWALKNLEDVDKPNLKVTNSSITISPPHLVEGQTVIIGCTVENNGTVAAEDVKVSFYLGNPLDGGEWIKDSENITSIGPSESAHAEITWVLDGVTGAEDIYVWVDPDNEINEISEEDNIASISFTSGTRPDLTISSADISFDNTAPLEGETFTMTAIIRNGGETDAGPVAVVLFDGDPENGGEKMGELTFNAIYGGSYGTATFDIALYAGTYDLHAEVDPENDIEEGNETNNITSKSITVRPIEFQGIDLAVSSSGIRFSPLYSREGDLITVSSIIRNSGDRDAHDVVVKLYDGNPLSGTQLVDHTYSTIMSGHEKILTLTANFPQGNHEIYVVVDPNDTIQEISEINNQAHKTLTIIPPGEVIDLAITTDDIGFDPQTPEVGEEVAIQCGIGNIGTVRLENVKVKIYEGDPDAKGSLLYPEFTLSFIEAGGSGQITIYRDTTDWGGDHLIYVTVDPENDILEENEENNRTSKLLTVSAPANPDLEVSANGTTFSPPEPKAGDTIVLNCIIENRGTEDVSMADVSFYIDGQLLRDVTVANLQAGGYATVSTNWDTTDIAGFHTICVIVDPLNSISEVNEFNNKAEKEITIGAPDLKVTYEDIAFNPEVPMGGEIVQINCEVHNIGLQPAVSFMISFYNGSTYESDLIETVSVAGIGAGVSEMAAATWQAPVADKSYRIYVKVDTSDTILEENESNNLARRTIYVTTQTDLTVSSSDVTFYPSQPTLDDMITLTALVWNRGGTDAIGVEVAFFDGNPDSGGVMIGDVHTISRLYRGTSESIEKSLFLSEGQHEIYVIADLNNTIAESDDTNNQASVPVTVSALNDLSVKAEEIDISPPEPVAGDTLTISALIHNRGNEEYPNVVVQFFDGSPETGGVQIGVDQEISLSGGEVVNVSTTYDNVSGGSHEITVIVDPYNDIVEDEEGNNRAYRRVIVSSPLPDLTVNHGNFTYAPLSPMAGEVVTLTARVSNYGDIPANTVLVRFYEGPPEVSGYHLGEVSIGSIEGNGIEDSTVDVILKEGTRELYVVVDPENDIEESNENNNVTMATLDVQELEGFYDDCGNSGQEPHLVQGTDTEITGADPFNSLTSLTASTHETSVQYTYTGLNPNAQYQLIVNYLEEGDGGRVQSLSADGITIHEALALPDGRAEYFTFQLPSETYSDGEVTLSFNRVSGPDVLVSEIFIVRRSSEKDDAVRDGIEWLKTHQSDRGVWAAFEVTRENAISLQALTMSGNTQAPEYNLIKQRVYGLQATNGSWDNSVWATSESIRALRAIGEPQDSEIIRNAVNWLKTKQRDDGSWEDCPRLTGLALMALINAGEDKDSEAVQNGKAWLINNQRDDGPNGTGYWGDRGGEGYPSNIWKRYYPLVGLTLASDPDNQIEQDAITSAVEYYRYEYWRGNNNQQTCIIYSYLNILLYTNKYHDEVSDVVKHLKDQQQADGGWVTVLTRQYSEPLETSEVIIVLLAAGEDGEAVSLGAQWLYNNTTEWGDLRYPYENSYDTALSILALNYVDVEKAYVDIQKAIERLVQIQYSDGSWDRLLTDNQNCHFLYGTYLLWALGGTEVEANGKSGAVSLARQYIIDIQNTTDYPAGSLWGWPHTACGGPYPSSIKETCYALLSILWSGGDTSDSRVEKGINWLLSNRGSNNRWETTENLCLIIMILGHNGNHPDELNDAINWMKQNQNPDGGWGDVDSTVIETSMAIIALSRAGFEGLETAKGIEWILSIQSSDSGWAGVPGTPASTTANTALAVWALAVFEYQMDINLELNFNKPYYYPGDLVKMAINPLNAEAGSLTLSGTVTEYEGEVLPITISQNGETFAAEHLLRNDHLPGTDMVNIVASGDSGQGSVTGSFVVKYGEVVLPDVSIVSDDIAFSSDTPQEGEPVNISATITNPEMRDAVNVTVRCFDGYPESGGILIGEESIERVCGLSRSSVDFSWQATFGMHEIYLVVDPEDILTETNEQNNQAYKTIGVSEITYEPDLSITASDVTLTPSDPVEGEEILIGAAVCNLGGSESIDVLVRLFDGNSQIGEDQIIPALSPGGAEVVEVVWDTLGEFGRNYIHVIVDPEDSIKESHEDNNEAIKTVDVGVPSRPDLAMSPSDISFDPQFPLEGETVTISATAHNRGEPIDNIKVNFYDGDPENGGSLIKEDMIYSTILFGESETLEVSWETVGAAQDHDIYIVVDPEDMIVEENEGNNSAYSAISVLSSELLVEVSLDESQYEADEDVSISTVITNLSSEQRVVTFDLLVMDSEGNTISELIISEVITFDPSGSVIRDVIWNTGGRKAGEYSIVAVVSENGSACTTDSADFMIIADMSLSVQVVSDRMAYFSYEQVRITSTIKSFSPNYTFSNLYTEITVKKDLDDILHSEGKSIDTLYPLDSNQWIIYWNSQTYPPGEYTLVSEVTDGGVGEASDLTSFSILPSYEGDKALKGTLAVVPDEVNQGEDVNLSYEVVNVGNVNLPEVNLLLQIVQVETQDFIMDLGDQCSLALGKSCSGFQTLSTAGMPAGACMNILLGEIEGISQTVAAAPLTIRSQYLDSDDDGIPDSDDDCPESNLETTIIIDDCDSGVVNQLSNDGCTMSDLIYECATGAKNHGKFVSCVSHLTNDWKKERLITGREKGAIQRCAAKSNIP